MELKSPLRSRWQWVPHILNLICFCLYTGLQAVLWGLQTNEVSLSVDNVYAVRILYFVLCLFIFPQFMSYFSIFPDFNFVMVSFKRMLWEISNYVTFCFVCVLLFSVLYRTLQMDGVDEDNEYFGLGFFRWLIFVARIAFMDSVI